MFGMAWFSLFWCGLVWAWYYVTCINIETLEHCSEGQPQPGSFQKSLE